MWEAKGIEVFAFLDAILFGAGLQHSVSVLVHAHLVRLPCLGFVCTVNFALQPCMINIHVGLDCEGSMHT